MKILQINLDRTRRGHDLMEWYSREIEADLIIMSEPNYKITSEKDYLTDLDNNAAIAIINKNLKIENVI